MDAYTQLNIQHYLSSLSKGISFIMPGEILLAQLTIL